MRNPGPGLDSGLTRVGGVGEGWGRRGNESEWMGYYRHSRKEVSREVSGWISTGVGKNLERQAEECTFEFLSWETQGPNCLVS